MKFTMLDPQRENRLWRLLKTEGVIARRNLLSAIRRARRGGDLSEDSRKHFIVDDITVASSACLIPENGKWPGVTRLLQIVASSLMNQDLQIKNALIDFEL